jgi:hypothetical protein
MVSPVPDLVEDPIANKIMYGGSENIKRLGFKMLLYQ